MDGRVFREFHSSGVLGNSAATRKEGRSLRKTYSQGVFGSLEEEGAPSTGRDYQIRAFYRQKLVAEVTLSSVPGGEIEPNVWKDLELGRRKKITLCDRTRREKKVKRKTPHTDY